MPGSHFNWALITVGAILHTSLWHPTAACFPGGRLLRRRTRQEPPLIYQEFVPNTKEQMPEASGMPQKPIKPGDRMYDELVENMNNLIVFLDKSNNSISRKMSARCKERLDTLAMLIVNQWPGLRLRVLKAWRPLNKDVQRLRTNLPVSMLLHLEGRAVDFVTSDLDKSKLGVLARLAVQSGFDWVYYEARGHIHASVKTDTPFRSKRSLRCFPSHATVRDIDGRSKPISRLVFGDLIQSFDVNNGKIVYSPFLAYLHANSSTIGQFVEISTQNRTKLVASDDHLLFVLRADEDNYSCYGMHNLHIGRMIAVSEAKPGDCLAVSSRGDGNFVQNSIVLEKIEKIRHIYARGLFAPLTFEGTVVVDDVVASNYAGVRSHNLAHWAMSPLRIFYYLAGRQQALSPKFLEKRSEGSGGGENSFHWSDDYPSDIHWYARIFWRLADAIEYYTSYSFFHE